MKIKFWNIVKSIESFIQNAATDVRTWTFPDKDGTVMMTNDVIDEDNFSTDSETRPPSQQSVRVYADAVVGVGTTSGTNDYTVNVGSPKTILTIGYLYAIKWAAASTGAVTLDIQSAGAKKVFKDPTTQAGNGDLVQNSVSLMMYQSTLDGGTGGYLIIGGVGGGGGAVDSVNGQTGVVVLDAADVGALPDTYTPPDASESTKGIAEIANQSEVNTGTDDTRIVTALKLKNRDGAVATLSDSATTDITSDKWTWATSATTRTTTFSFNGDSSEGVITLTGTALTITFPSGCLCVSGGLASGDNTAALSGVSGDKYYVSIRKMGSEYYVVIKNFGQ